MLYPIELRVLHAFGANIAIQPAHMPNTRVWRCPAPRGVFARNTRALGGGESILYVHPAAQAALAVDQLAPVVRSHPGEKPELPLTLCLALAMRYTHVRRPLLLKKPLYDRGRSGLVRATHYDAEIQLRQPVPEAGLQRRIDLIDTEKLLVRHAVQSISPLRKVRVINISDVIADRQRVGDAQGSRFTADSARYDRFDF